MYVHLRINKHENLTPDIYKKKYSRKFMKPVSIYVSIHARRLYIHVITLAMIFTTPRSNRKYMYTTLLLFIS